MATIKRIASGSACAVAVIIAIVISAGNVRTSERGLELIGNAESCRRDPYACPAGVLTDGIGNTHGVKAGVIKTDTQIAEDWERTFLMLNAASFAMQMAINYRPALLMPLRQSALTPVAH